MTTTTETPPARATWRDAFVVYLKPRVLIVLFLGFSSGLPLALSSSTLAVWMREVGVDLGTIGLFTLVGTPYTIKFLWAPVVDALDVPVLDPAAGPAARLADAVAIHADGGDPHPRAVQPEDFAAHRRRRRRHPGRHRVGDPGHPDRRLSGREPRPERAGGRHGVLCRGLSHRHAGLDRGRALRGQRLRGVRRR